MQVIKLMQKLIVGVPEYKRWTRDFEPRPWSPSRTPPFQDEDVWTPSHSESGYLSKKQAKTINLFLQN